MFIMDEEFWYKNYPLFSVCYLLSVLLVEFELFHHNVTKHQIQGPNWKVCLESDHFFQISKRILHKANTSEHTLS